MRRLRFGRIAPSSLATAGGLALLVLGAACSGPPARTPEAPAEGGWLAFTGSWTASGTRTTLDLDAHHWASIMNLNGSLLLAGANKPGVGFRAEMVGFADSVTGLVGRSVWTDEHGDQVFSELAAASVRPDTRIKGTFVGGTGRFAGATGEYEFGWQYLIESDDGTVQGHTTGLRGRVRLGGEAPTGEDAGR